MLILFQNISQFNNYFCMKCHIFEVEKIFVICFPIQNYDNINNRNICIKKNWAKYTNSYTLHLNLAKCAYKYSIK